MSEAGMDKAVVLARGLGTRMQKPNPAAALTRHQAGVADTGVKAMMPIARAGGRGAASGAERPFLDYVLSALADAGYRRICLVVGPEDDVLRSYYTRTHQPARLSIDFAVQVEPLGTADAVAAAETWAGDEPFLVINSDNFYPVEAMQGLRELGGAGLVAFERHAMLADSNIPADRLTRFAVIEFDANGEMVRIVEKPDQETIDSLPEPVCVSMNCWRFGRSIFEGCRSIRPSARGELELPDAVQYTIDRMGETFRVLMVRAAVLDLSSRADVGPVADRLAAMEVRL